MIGQWHASGARDATEMFWNETLSVSLAGRQRYILHTTTTDTTTTTTTTTTTK